MKYKIGIFGSAVLDNDTIISKAHELGRVLSKYNVILITGAGKGLPYQVVAEAKKSNDNIEIWGFPPVADEQGLKEYTQDDTSIYAKITYISNTFPFATAVEACRQYRNVISTATCDAGIIISGRWGTLNEFTNLQGEEKVIGVLTGTEGIADELPNLTKKIHKESKAIVVFERSPKELVKKVLAELDKRQKNVIV